MLKWIIKWRMQPKWYTVARERSEVLHPLITNRYTLKHWLPYNLIWLEISGLHSFWNVLINSAFISMFLWYFVCIILQEKQVAHIQNFTETERHLNQACRLDKRLEQLADDVNNRLAIIYANDPGALGLAK